MINEKSVICYFGINLNHDEKEKTFAGPFSSFDFFLKHLLIYRSPLLFNLFIHILHLTKLEW